jgi:putative SOS response-associated peptidase YedK
MNLAFTGLQRGEYFKKFYPIDHIACDKISRKRAKPPHEVLVIVNRNGKNWLDRFHWGLVPDWAKDTSVGMRLINARLETVAEKPSFRRAFKRQRCLIPAQGFYEWAKLKNAKRAVYIQLPTGKPFAFAGIWEVWRKEKSIHTEYKSCAIITTRASASIRPIHHRMPIILKPEAYAAWLDPRNQDAVSLNQILKASTLTEFINDMPEASPKARHQQLSLLD